MSQTLVDQIARAVLYEGYILYPYGPSVKNSQRWTFGGVFPRAFSESQNTGDACMMQAQCLLTGDSQSTTIKAELRFLQLMDRTVERQAASGLELVSSLAVDGRTYLPWQEAIERSVPIPAHPVADLMDQPRQLVFRFPEATEFELLDDVGRLVRRQEELCGSIHVSIKPAGEAFQLTVLVQNDSPMNAKTECNRDAALMRSLASTHLILNVEGGGFISSIDPPEHYKPMATDCKNVGCWPVLAGAPGQTDTMLASPIILYDYPQVAPESPGDLFDGCEIDEILTLRIMTLTDDEKRQAAGIDPLAANLMARTQSLARQQLMDLHGVMKHTVPEADHG